ncbi:unnamed protein product [Diplocarpon coronariae]|uniref:Uncharacterized protein n=1 Tax=Diplocarpon coronariae TaxID=2795749 RepID=A0A218ZAY6_9HELO|nr:hypothetical protein JHW43_004983 [Diplocarpon mali]OWP05229.1 hypothetical protein B2J93_7971 [Marssonina coronariae]
MRRLPKPAEVEEEDPATGEPRPNTRTSASYSARKERRLEQDQAWRKSNLPLLPYMQSKHLGPVQEATARNNRTLTIAAGEHEDNQEVWREVGGRVVFFKDRVINGETKTYVNREILISARDLSRQNPDLLIAQRVYDSNGSVRLRAHRLLFGPRIVLETPYAFAQLGDEIPGVGCPDLHCTFRAAQSWGSQRRKPGRPARDEHLTVDLCPTDVCSERQILYDLDQKRIVGPKDPMPRVGIEVEAAELFPKLADALGPRDSLSTGPKSCYPSPPAFRKRRLSDSEEEEEEEEEGSKVSKKPRKVGIKLVGMGKRIGSGEARGDVYVDFVLRE